MLLGLTSTAQADPPIGGPVVAIEINGSTDPGTAAIDGFFDGGTFTYSGATYGCVGGSASGTIRRSPIVAGAEMTFPAGGLNLTCAMPLGNMVFDLLCPITVHLGRLSP